MPPSVPEPVDDPGLAVRRAAPGVWRLMLRPGTAGAALKVSLLVGVALNVINNGEQFRAHHRSRRRFGSRRPLPASRRSRPGSLPSCATASSTICARPSARCRCPAWSTTTRTGRSGWKRFSMSAAPGATDPGRWPGRIPRNPCSLQGSDRSLLRGAGTALEMGRAGVATYALDDVHRVHELPQADEGAAAGDAGLCRRQGGERRARVRGVRLTTGMRRAGSTTRWP